MTSLQEKVICILENSDFNDLPLEERKKICKYTSQMQILTLWQVLEKNQHLTTEAWRKKMQDWILNCVRLHEKKYGKVWD